MSVAPRTWSSITRIRPRIARNFKLCLTCACQFSNKTPVKEDDIVLLRKKGDDNATPIITKRLQRHGKIQTPRGFIDHASVIGKNIRDVVQTNKKVEYRIHQPTLAEYVTLCPRIVTPIYPADANLIVSLLDLHPSKESDDQPLDRPLEIFEAGTGHGALTLHLARAIHGENPTAPPIPAVKERRNTIQELVPGTGDESRSDAADSAEEEVSHKFTEEQTTWENYLPKRRAVIHTLDISDVHSRHAQSVVRNFRNGLYFHNIDFHVGTIPEYLSSRLVSTPEPFLEHAILDLPTAHSYFDNIAKALKPNGSLIVFTPSITQITSCVQLTREKRLPFILESVLELGAGVGVGGREWDVRTVKPRAWLKAEAEARRLNEENGDVLMSSSSSADACRSDTEDGEKDTGLGMICRPKVGGRISGGGFLGLWRRMEYFTRDAPLS